MNSTTHLIQPSEDYMETSVNKVRKISSQLQFRDHLGTFKARMNIGRMNYKINPGLYAVGDPDAESFVFVTANYKMSFDYLRRELTAINAWILVLDTKGINVWCAAGKGTFGTAEIIKKVKQTNLEKIVSHRQLILPQLGAPGVAAHVVQEQTGFRIIYGPIKASDLPAFIQAGKKATKEMRKVRFNIYDRMILIPVDVSGFLKYIVLIIAVFFLLSGLNRNGYSISTVLSIGTGTTSLILVAFFSGTIITPLLLPFIPGRAFALKGFVVSSITFFLLILSWLELSNSGFVEIMAWFFIVSAISSFTAMNFTGASTYTSLSGVKKEMRIALPLQLAGFVIGFILWSIKRFV